VISSVSGIRWNEFCPFHEINKGGPEPSEKEIHEILGSKREDRFPDPFFDLVQNTSLDCFSYLLRLCNFCKAPRDMRKFPQKCQKIAGCWGRAVYGSRPPIASTPGASSPEWPSLDNFPSQPWSDATCPCTTSWSAYFRFVTLFLLKKTRQSTRSSVTGPGTLRQTMVDSWYCLVRVVPEGMSQSARQLEVENHKRRTLSTRLSSGTSAGTFEVSAGPYINFCYEAGTKNEPDIFLYQFKKRVRKSILTFRT